MIVHAGAVAFDRRAVLILGPSGSGKSSLALELMSRGASLVSDDRTILR
ncbi:MAG: HPr kinase/phosphorylase, partial [Paracoccaceae bacterium]